MKHLTTFIPATVAAVYLTFAVVTQHQMPAQAVTLAPAGAISKLERCNAMVAELLEVTADRAAVTAKLTDMYRAGCSAR